MRARLVRGDEMSERAATSGAHPRVLAERPREGRGGEPSNQKRQRGPEHVPEEHPLAVVPAPDRREGKDGERIPSRELGAPERGILGLAVHLRHALEGVPAALLHRDDLDTRGRRVRVGARSQRGGFGRRVRVASPEPPLGLGGRGLGFGGADACGATVGAMTGRGVRARRAERARAEGARQGGRERHAAGASRLGE